jgi:DHA1 family bicyclomycin/chloramphenicol resistance-like MFS transporter
VDVTAETRAVPVHRIRLVVVLGALSTFGPLSIDMYLPALPKLSHDFSTGASQVQLTLTACLIGLALGQIVAGPLSDARGRRGPLLAGVGAYAAASAACAVAPSIYALVGLRLFQGIGGGAGLVIARAVVRDLYEGAAAARFFSWLMLVSGTAPILAPLIGAQILRVASWRAVFLVLGAIGCALFVAALLGLRETLPAERRTTGSAGGTLETFSRLLHDRRFDAHALTIGFGFGTLFAYISASPFVIQDIYGASPQLFSAFFAINAVGIVACGQVNGLLVLRHGPARMLQIGSAVMAAGGLGVLAAVVVHAPLAGLFVPLFVAVACIGFVMPNATALALTDHPHIAGSASALLGLIQFTVGAAVAPLVGVAGKSSAVPMAVVIASCALACASIRRVLASPAR